MRETIGVVHILIAGEAAEHRLAKQPAQQVPGVLAAAAFRQRRTRQIGQPKRIIQFAIGQQSAVRGDTATVEFQPQPPVEINPQGAIIRFTRWVFHPRASLSTTTR